ncbi:MAG TPA: 23S rRNA (pseudouridine(1915)-N(3))-methyltransferase RlmH [Bacteroidales bacterium]|nr:23S rRNA (pseudouridine(1915)-N(3))-methyltransferase RlmH [Bacteroidales bacterium]
MKITLVAIGKTNENYITKGFDNYAKRINRYCRFDFKILPELKNTKSMPVELQLQKEGDMLLAEMGNYQESILLDEHGKLYTSVEFAGFIEKRMISGQRDMAFVIGGPYGFDQRVKAACHGKLSVSLMTFSHQLIRLLFAEQLYRAFTIIKGDPYHNP